jgi:hypothetical protein
MNVNFNNTNSKTIIDSGSDDNSVGRDANGRHHSHQSYASSKFEETAAIFKDKYFDI